jgi:O-antigen/teichoic acid export membrane protein
MTRALALSAWKSVLRNSSSLRAVFTGQLISALGMAISSRVVTEVVRPEALGEYKLAAGAVGLGTALGLRPFLQFFMRELHDARRQALLPQFLAYAGRELYIFWGWIFLVLAAGLAVWRTQELRHLGIVIPLCGLLVLLHGLVNFRLSLLTTSNRQWGASTIRTLLQVGIPLSTAVGASIGGQLGLALLAGEAVFLGALVLTLRWVESGTPVHEPLTPAQVAVWRKAALRFGFPLLIVGISSWVLSVSDRFIMTAFTTTSVIGAYTAVYGLASAPLLMVSGMGAQVVYPLIFRAAAEKGAAGSHTVFLRNLLVSSAVCLSAFLMYLLFGWLLIALLLAEPYRPGAQPVLLWVAAGYTLLALAAPFELKIYAEKTTSRMNLAYSVAAAVNILLNLYWIPSQGAVGAAKATFFGFATYLAVLAGLTLRKAGPLQASPAS